MDTRDRPTDLELVDDPRGRGVRIALRRSRRSQTALGYVLGIAALGSGVMLVVFGRPRTLGSADLDRVFLPAVIVWGALMVAAGVLLWRLLRSGRRAAYLHLTPAALCTADLRIPWSQVRAFPVRVVGRPDNTEGIGVVVGDLEDVVGFARAKVALANWRGRPLRLADIDQLPAAHPSVLRGLSLLGSDPRTRALLDRADGLALFRAS